MEINVYVVTVCVKGVSGLSCLLLLQIAVFRSVADAKSSELSCTSNMEK